MGATPRTTYVHTREHDKVIGVTPDRRYQIFTITKMRDHCMNAASPSDTTGGNLSARLLAEISRRAAIFQPQSCLFVDYYRIRQRVAFALPITSVQAPDFTIRNFNRAYPWAVWMGWALEERVAALGYAAQWGVGPALCAEAASRDLQALCAWPSFRQSPDQPHLIFAHAARILWWAVIWTWPDERLRNAVHIALHRIAEDAVLFSEKIARFKDSSHFLKRPQPHKYLTNIFLIGLIAGAVAARTSGHDATAELDRRVWMCVTALLDLRATGVTEGVAYDGYVFDFLADWLKGLPREDGQKLYNHPHFDDTFKQSLALAVPGDVTDVAELGDVESREMPFHLSAQAKLQALAPNTHRAWFLRNCDLRHLRVDGLAALKAIAGDLEIRDTPPEVGAIDVNYAVVLRSGWADDDLMVAAGASTSPMGHIQADNGSLVIGTRRHWAIEDAGYQQYLETSEREFTLGAAAHNAPVVNGFAPSEKRLGYKHLDGDAGVQGAQLDLTPAYPSDAETGGVTRSLWLLDRDIIVVCDRFDMSNLKNVSYTWHGNRRCGWWIGEDRASLCLSEAVDPLLHIACLQTPFRAHQVSRLRGSRGQMSLSVEILPEDMAIADGGLGQVVWLFWIGEKRPQAELTEACIAIGERRLHPSAFSPLPDAKNLPS